MAVEGGEVVISGAGALCAVLLRAILARMALWHPEEQRVERIESKCANCHVNGAGRCYQRLNALVCHPASMCSSFSPALLVLGQCLYSQCRSVVGKHQIR
jgi:hypothetical protein